MTEFDLDDFGITEGISEVIVTTYQGWSPNAAPIGIIRKGDDVFVRLFKGSQTYKNVKAERMLVANLVYDPLIFVRSTFGNITESEFKVLSYGGRAFATVRDSSCWVVFECDEFKETSGAIVAKLIPRHAHVGRCIFNSINRGFNLVVESCVHATRYELTNNEKYMRLIEAYSITVNKCGSGRDKEAMELLLKRYGEQG
ncbi:DUF447 domain-containing protein [Methanococcoides burtonii]|uniref:DUF447 family protein n=1 Tax=Methanococcoides burtonii (strain DSM 6242 / NBRC 107633 / OCM 468 / ACE-M) TaxID=259564 RepID=Q12ZA2_METBU|nr:DUF447 domain-containing protein [Methanococcoides burtonii]ABE51224.1 Protein of unknown function DUF447, FMN binding [Methanococcoides burtonii DSM 6242]